jgi:hypothetical protein
LETLSRTSIINVLFFGIAFFIFYRSCFFDGALTRLFLEARALDNTLDDLDESLSKVLLVR